MARGTQGLYAHLDSDEARLPEGMQRVGYDADTQTYTFRDADGGLWESEEGNRFGTLHPAGRRPLLSADDAAPSPSQTLSRRARSGDLRYLLPFFLVVCVVLLLLFRFVDGGGRDPSPLGALECAEGWEVYAVAKGDTCWEIARARGMEVEELEEGNVGRMDCERLDVGSRICVKQAV